ncbi:hydrolase [Sphingomonas sp. MAH-20]|uniref:Hydrolase n=1 Tax=Sphingomonas horti TaxID=2682842 RepID=A0A6I4J3S9_9SPHN|nr:MULTISPECIES: hydrolase [Sphingomonas]MBA2918963.1 hydrolase [Sphingomonas sp. CGMCC 1.13658]MVO78996.1 hydrolase [Sphingomonas horti]
MKIQLRSSELSTLLDQAPPGVRWLSLDCFDTLVWRDTATPADVFADLDFPGGAIEPRRRAEDAARAWAKLYRDSFEVSLDDIHERLRPGGDVAASVEAELAAEARHCFGFEPVKQLIRDAKARGLGVMIVSDTYLDEAQLRALIATAAGADIAALIDRVFPSSAYGMNKSDGLFGPVLEALGAAPGELLHVGDNPVADQVAPSELGINTVHLLQFDDAARARLRLEAAASAMIQPDVRVTRPAWQPHRPLVSLREESDPAFALGHDVLGPLLQTYAHWLREERRAIAERSGRRTHLLFLLRDGFLPGRVFEELFADEPARLVEISRHTAAGASLVDEAAVRARLFHEGKYISVGMLAGQFHFKQGELAKLKLDELADDPDFVATVLRPEMLRQIVHRSARFADRLMAHLKRVGVAEGDAVIFADLGYQGSVQDQIAPMLVERMGLQVAGRYLLLREGQQTGLDKRGLIDARHYDQRVLDSLFGPIAVLEQLCTIAQGSVVDYKFDGTPVRKVAGIKSAQSATRDRAQAGAVAFARRSKDVALPGDFEPWRIAAGASLARLLYLPTPEEVEVLLRFDHDVNLGTEALVPLVDSEAAVAGLRSRGLPYLMHANRIYIPGEIRGQGLSLNLSMLAWCRYGLEITTGDMAGFPMTLPVIIADAQGQTLTEIEAHPTHDGYYAMAVPMGAGRFTVGVQWGAVLECVQIESARVHIVESFGTKGDGLSVPATPVHDGMETLAPGLYRCTSLASLTMVPPPGLKRDVDVMLYIVFRPVVRRGEAADVRQAA